MTSTSQAYKDTIKALLLPILEAMLKDENLDNHRLGLTTANSAIHNQPHLVLPALNQILPTITKDTHIRAELVREVQMGPFKHKIDDGVELRKVSRMTSN